MPLAILQFTSSPPSLPLEYGDFWDAEKKHCLNFKIIFYGILHIKKLHLKCIGLILMFKVQFIEISFNAVLLRHLIYFVWFIKN